MPLKSIKIKLEQGGSCDKDDAGWINGCKPGYRHNDPLPGHENGWAISGSKLPMMAEDFETLGL